MSGVTRLVSAKRMLSPAIEREDRVRCLPGDWSSLQASARWRVRVGISVASRAAKSWPSTGASFGDIYPTKSYAKNALVTAAYSLRVAGAKPLLVIDGDSFAHRSYHALPKTIRRQGGSGSGRSRKKHHAQHGGE